MLRAAGLVAAWPACAESHLLTEEAPPTSFSRDDGRHGRRRGTRADQTYGRPGKFELLPWTRGYHPAQQKPKTAIFSTVRTPEREAKFQWVGPLLIGTTCFYSPKSRNRLFGSPQQAAAGAGAIYPAAAGVGRRSAGHCRLSMGCALAAAGAGDALCSGAWALSLS